MEMAFLQRLFSNLKKTDHPEIVEFQKWTSPLPADSILSEHPVRLLMLRDSESRGKKLLFDSETTIRDNPPLSKGCCNYDQITDGIGYKYIHPSRKDTKQFGEMIFGTVPIANQTDCLKVHTLDECDQIMWSSLFTPAPSQKSQNRPNSLMSLDSSYGSNLGSIQGNTKGSLLSSNDALVTSNPDSGVFSSDYSCCDSNKSSNQNDSFSCIIDSVFHNPESFISINAKPVNSFADSKPVNSFNAKPVNSFNAKPVNSFNAKPVNSFADSKHPDLIIPPMINIVPTSTPSINQTNPSFSQQSGVGNFLAVKSSTKSMSRQSKVVLATAVIINSPPGLSHMLLEASAFMEDLVNKVKLACQSAYQNRSIFIHQLYNAWIEATNDVIRFFTSPRLESLTCHTLASDDDQKRIAFVQEFVDLKKMFDTKENKFFFSTLISAVLTYHTGWVYSTGFKDKGCENESRVLQYRQLYGLLGSQHLAAKTVLVGEEEHLVKRLLSVLTYFLRCLKLEARFISFQESKPQQSLVKNPPKKSSSNLLRTPSVNQLRSEKQFTKGLTRKKSYNLLKKEEESNYDAEFSIEPLQTLQPVVFEVGGSEEFRTLKSVARKCRMERESGHLSDVQINVTKTKFSRIHVTEKASNGFPSIVCISDSLMPGSVMQACIIKKAKKSRSSIDELKQLLRRDLRSSQLNSWARPYLTESCSILANCSTGDVELCSSKRHGIANQAGDFHPIIAAPVVANLIDSIEIVAKVSSSLVISSIEDGLGEICAYSKALSQLLLQSDVTTIDTLSTVLGVDKMDIPLLMTIASIYNPVIKEKCGITFFN